MCSLDPRRRPNISSVVHQLERFVTECAAEVAAAKPKKGKMTKLSGEWKAVIVMELVIRQNQQGWWRRPPLQTC